jgi:LacI family transcriptional regulator
MATLKQVAERAGVAPSTVSFVLNKSPRVSEETRELVLKAAQDLKYTLARKGRPRRAEGMAPGRRRKDTVAFILPFATSALHANPVYVSALQAAEAALAQSNRGMLVRSLRDDEAPNVAWLSSRVDGVLMIMHDPVAVISEIAAQIPTVQLLGIIREEGSWDQVTYDNDIIGSMAARYLLQRGHRHCGFLAPQAGMPRHVRGVSTYTARERTFLQAVRAGGGKVRMNSSALLTWPTAPDEMRIALHEIMDVEPRPTALFVPGDNLCLLAYGLLFAMGIRPGKDVDVISCNNDVELLRGLHPRPASIDVHAPWIGAAAVGQLLQRLNTPQLPRSVHRFQPVLVPAEGPWPGA